jgi:hypothetical protein
MVIFGLHTYPYMCRGTDMTLLCAFVHEAPCKQENAGKRQEKAGKRQGFAG